MPIPQYLLPRNLTKKTSKLKTRSHLFDFMLHMNPAQQSIAREALHQMSGKRPSSIYGRLKLTGALKNEHARKRASKIAGMHHIDMCKHIAQDKEVGSGFGSFFRKMGKIASKVVNHVSQHADTYGALASNIGQATGVIDEETGQMIEEGAKMLKK